MNSHHVHFLNRAMTILAGHPAGNVTLVGKTHIVGEIVDLDPLDRFVLIELLGDFLDEGLVRRDQLVAAHTGVRWGNARNRRAPGRGVAIFAGDFLIARVQLVAKRDRLRRLKASIIDRIARRPHPPGVPGGAKARRRHEENQLESPVANRSQKQLPPHTAAAKWGQAPT